jgi:hypothetical protein
VPITITAEQRDALYDDLLTHLSGLDDLWAAIDRGSYELADRLGREFTDDLRLILEDLGWGDVSGGGTVDLTLASDALRRVLTGLRGRAKRHAEGEAAVALSEAREARGQSILVVKTCDELLTTLPEDPEGS